jgi:hypothetical protein
MPAIVVLQTEPVTPSLLRRDVNFRARPAGSGLLPSRPCRTGSGLRESTVCAWIGGSPCRRSRCVPLLDPIASS